MDYAAILYGPVYSVLSVPATLVVADAGYSVRAIDKTAGIAIDSGDLAVQTLSPAATVRTDDLATAMRVPVSYLKSNRFDPTGAALRLNGGEWRVTSDRHQPSPDGGGEILLLLEAAANPCSVLSDS